ncbi:phage replication initiation protein [Lactiplantibacillus plantarum]|nr:phage replication initiation protein [Lactiplantibacillus plantarum]MCG0855626.1 phage replication initiation protein [Lactiplantibacillus plantarum]
MNNLLISEPPLQVLPSLAVKVGLNEAIVLQQFHYWLNRSNNERDGYKWIYNSYTSWHKQFPFWSIKTLKRAITSLEKDEFLISGNYNKAGFDKTKWYRINYEKLEGQPLGQNGPTNRPECPNGVAQNGPTNTNRLPETTTETTNNKRSNSKTEYGPDDPPYKVALHLLTRIKQRQSDFKEPNLQKWANDIRLAHERDHRDYEKLDWLVDWSQDNSFWQANILSAGKLRKQYDTLMGQAERNRPTNVAPQTREDWFG